MKKKQAPIPPRLSEQIFKAVVNSFFATGVIKEEDLKDKDSLLKKIRSLFKNNSPFNIYLDHREEILRTAETFKKDKNIDFAKIFYAVYFEHSINFLIHNECLRRNISINIQKDIIQNLNIHGKFTWLLIILGFKPFSLAHWGTIKKLCDDRNGFIHYKWKPDPRTNEIPDIKKEEETRTTEFKKIKAAITYLKNYESRYLYNKNKRKLKSLIKLR